jgi:hypothetical protein
MHVLEEWLDDVIFSSTIDRKGYSQVKRRIVRRSSSPPSPPRGGRHSGGFRHDERSGGEGWHCIGRRRTSLGIDVKAAGRDAVRPVRFAAGRNDCVGPRGSGRIGVGIFDWGCRDVLDGLRDVCSE